MYYKDYIEERMNGMIDILESSDIVMEFFKLKKERKGDYTIASINKEINAIKKDIKEIISNNEDIKDFINKGIKITNNKDTFEFADEKDDEQYHSGCPIYVIDIDLNKYRKKDLSSRGEHPVDNAVKKLEKLIRDLIKRKYPNFKYSGYDGDFDKGNLFLTIK